MIQTAMQELKSDLILTKEITLNSFSAIKNQEIKDACIKVVEMTLNSIITRIDTELLAMEKEQSECICVNVISRILDESEQGKEINSKEIFEDVYKQTFKSE